MAATNKIHNQCKRFMFDSAEQPKTTTIRLFFVQISTICSVRDSKKLNLHRTINTFSTTWLKMPRKKCSPCNYAEHIHRSQGRCRSVTLLFYFSSGAVYYGMHGSLPNQPPVLFLLCIQQRAFGTVVHCYCVSCIGECENSCSYVWYRTTSSWP